jgi:hypothetical protein
MDLAKKFQNWTPVRVYWRDGRPLVDWCYMGATRFTQPFFDNTVEQQMKEPFSLLFRHQTPLDLLGDLYERQPGLEPTGFIFHMSRRCSPRSIATSSFPSRRRSIPSFAPTRKIRR